MDSIEKAFDDTMRHANPAAASVVTDVRMTFEVDETAATGAAALEMGLKGFKARMHGRMTPRREIWTERPLTIEVCGMSFGSSVAPSLAHQPPPWPRSSCTHISERYRR